MTPDPSSREYVSRGGVKLAAALEAFCVDACGLVCADLGSHAGGFVDCLLRRGAARVHAVDTGYGVLDYRLRRDARVVVHERTNALHFECAEPCDLVTIDVGWTRQRLILLAASRMLRAGGRVITLVKPHYEAPRAWLVEGVLRPERMEEVIASVRSEIESLQWRIERSVESPIKGHGGNMELLLLLSRREQ